MPLARAETCAIGTRRNVGGTHARAGRNRARGAPKLPHLSLYLSRTNHDGLPTLRPYPTRARPTKFPCPAAIIASERDAETAQGRKRARLAEKRNLPSCGLFHLRTFVLPIHTSRSSSTRSKTWWLIKLVHVFHVQELSNTPSCISLRCWDDHSTFFPVHCLQTPHFLLLA
jgi:hypothetical protein